MNINGCLSLTQISGYNSHRRPCIMGKLKGHKFIGICQQVEIDKNNTCLILSVLCKKLRIYKSFWLSGAQSVTVCQHWVLLGCTLAKEKALVRVKTWLEWCMMYEPHRQLLFQLLHLFTLNTYLFSRASPNNCWRAFFSSCSSDTKVKSRSMLGPWRVLLHLLVFFAVFESEWNGSFWFFGLDFTLHS